MKKGIKEFLAMRNMAEDISSESTSKHDHLLKDWLAKIITEIEDKRCTRISCTNEGLSDTYAWEETHSDNSLWVVESHLEEVADHIPYGSKNKIPCSSIDWVDRDTLGIKDVGGKEFNFCNKFFGVNGIVMICGQP